MKCEGRRLESLIRVARGGAPADVCVRGVQLVNVLSGRVEPVDLAVHDGIVVGWGEYESKETIDASGMYACPGFIDAHLHIESTMLSPARFCSAVIPWGTAAVIADPHEIANVHGLEGIRYFLQATRTIPLDVTFRLPSCVPATSMETAGASLTGPDLWTLLPEERLEGLAEMMNFPGVVDAFPDVLDKLVLFQGGIIDGHAPRLSGLHLNAYLTPGITSDHECTTYEEAREKLAKGMHIMIREGSQSKDLAALMPVVDHHSWPRCMLVSDDRHPDDLLREGHMNAIVNRAVDLGMDPVRAITLATWTPARYAGMNRRGALAPGFAADFSLSPTLHPWQPRRVFKAGVEVARDGNLLVDPGSWGEPRPPVSPMRITRLAAEGLKVAAAPGLLRVIGVEEGTIITRHLHLAPRIEAGEVVSDPSRDILKLAVYNRYVPDRPPTVGFVQGLGLRTGAIATTVAHDSHNLMVAGVSDEDMLHLVDVLRKTGGGLAVGASSGPVDVLPLPIAGLMSDQPLETVVAGLDALKARAAQWGSSLRNPFMALSFLALPVIPELKLTDAGLVDVSTFSFVSLFAPN